MTGQGIVRHVDIAVGSMQGQVVSRIQLAVIGNHNVLFRGRTTFRVQRLYINAAFLGLGGAVHGNHAVRYLQVNIVLCQDCVRGRHFTYLNIAVCRGYGHIGVVGSNRSDDCGAAIIGSNGHIAASCNSAGAVRFTNGNAAGIRNFHRHLAFGRHVFPYQDATVFHSHGHVLARGNLLANANITSACGQSDRTIPGGNCPSHVN